MTTTFYTKYFWDSVNIHDEINKHLVYLGCGTYFRAYALYSKMLA